MKTTSMASAPAHCAPIFDSTEEAKASLLTELARQRQDARACRDRMSTLRQAHVRLIPPALEKLQEALRSTQGVTRVGSEQVEKSLRFGVAALAAPLVTPVIGNEVAGLTGSGLGMSLGLGKWAEFSLLCGRSATAAAFIPPFLVGEAAWKGVEAACLNALGNPGFAERAEALGQQVRDAAAAAHAAQARTHALEEQISQTYGVCAIPPEPVDLPARKKVVVVSLSAGGGHDAAVGAIRDALGAEFEVKVVKPYDSGSDVYNAAQLQTPGSVLDLFGYMQRMTDILNEVVGVSDALYGAELDHIMTTENPALVISTAPMENAATWRAAQRHNIPMCVVPTDLEFAHFVRNIHNPGENFRLLLPFAATRDQAAHLADSAIAVTGYPVRHAFTADGMAPSEPTSTVLRDLGIAPADRVVMLMMGAQGTAQDLIVRDAQSLMTMLPGAMPPGENVHIAVLCGDNHSLITALSAVDVPGKTDAVRLHALGRRDAVDVAALMRKADVLITKPGGATVNEALAANLPMIYHSDLHVVHWELGNANYAASHNMAQWTEGEEISAVVTRALRKGRPQELTPCPGRAFPANLKRVVAELLAPNTALGADDACPPA